jgi:hypothetical protein
MEIPPERLGEEMRHEGIEPRDETHGHLELERERGKGGRRRREGGTSCLEYLRSEEEVLKMKETSLRSSKSEDNQSEGPGPGLGRGIPSSFSSFSSMDLTLRQFLMRSLTRIHLRWSRGR